MRGATDSNRREFARYSSCDGLDGLEVMSALWLEHSFAPHMHDFYAISLNHDGRGAFDCRRDTHDALPGTCNLIAPGELHTGRATSGAGWSYSNLHVDASMMAQLLHSIEWRGPLEVDFKSSLVKDSVLRARLARLFASLSEAGSLLEHESLLLSVVARLATHHFVRGSAASPAGREHTAVTRAREWLNAHSEQNVSTRALAAVAGLSPYYLVRAFHRQVGMPPHRYQTIVRVHRARKLLASGGALADVAFRTGFCDQSHLTRCFKKTLGVPPGRYAASYTDRSAVRHGPS
jgi:AraC-like DNA-binding protein